MRMEFTWPLCEYADCDDNAVAAVHAQWTIVDFLEYAVCSRHIWNVRRFLRVQLVDGLKPVDVWTTYWDQPDV